MHAKFCWSLLLFTTLLCGAQVAPLPQIRSNGAGKLLFVDNKPFIMLAGELHNSSASSTAYMKPIWEKLSSLHLNTVIGTASWELVEPEEGVFDFSLVDDQIREARSRNMRLVLIWFASWKNAGSGYLPHWVKADAKRFPRMAIKGGSSDSGIGATMATMMEQNGTVPVSPLGEETLKADSNAFRALMRHIKQVDTQHTVIMMQVENESGSLGSSRDHSQVAEAAWVRPVPAELMNYLIKKKATLLPETLEVWGRNGFKASGTWSEVFGNDVWADEVFNAYYIAHFIGEVAKAGKAELNIPMYANAWLGPQPNADFPGQYPSGGPVARVLDVYRAAAPSLDFFAPDIYVDDFKGTCALYARSGNPLFIPEARDLAGNLFWALGKYAAMGWSPFGIEDLDPTGQVSQSYSLLSEMIPQLASWQAQGKVGAFLVADGDEAAPIPLGGYSISLSRIPKRRMWAAEPAEGSRQDSAPKSPTLLAGGVSLSSRAMSADSRPFAIVINSAPDEFLLIGANGVPNFAPLSGSNSRVVISSIDEGRYEKGKWIPGRRINGDETFAAGLPKTSIGMLKIRLLRVD